MWSIPGILLVDRSLLWTWMFRLWSTEVCKTVDFVCMTYTWIILMGKWGLIHTKVLLSLPTIYCFSTRVREADLCHVVFDWKYIWNYIIRPTWLEKEKLIILNLFQATMRWVHHHHWSSSCSFRYFRYYTRHGCMGKVDFLLANCIFSSLTLG